MEGKTAGGSRNFLSHRQNPRFPFTVCDESAVTAGDNVRITLHQRRPDADLHPIGFHIYKVSETLREKCGTSALHLTRRVRSTDELHSWSRQ